MRSLPALRHGKNVMKIHFLWILFWLYACDLAQSQTCMIRVLQVEGEVSRLAPTRPAWRCPLNVITGTPIHNASQVVVVPLKGKGSSAMSTRW
jgi:hypothetical protein